MAKIKKKPLICCCSVLLLVVLVAVAVLVALYFTLFRPKAPRVVATPVDVRLGTISIIPPPPVLDLSIGLDIVVDNPNYADFRYGSATTEITYHGLPVGAAPVPAGGVNARSTERISTRADVDAVKVVSSPWFIPDFIAGALTFSSASAVDGKAVVLGVFKMHARTQVACTIKVYVLTNQSSSECTYSIQV